MKNSNIGRMLIALVVFSTALGSCTYANTSPDQFACVYGGGISEARTQKGKIDPGSGRDYVGMGDEVVYLDANVRQYIVDDDPNRGDVDLFKRYVFPANDGVEMNYGVSAKFRYNTDIGCDFYDEYGRRFQVETDEGWVKFLNQNIQDILESEVRGASTSYDSEDIWRDKPQESGDLTQEVMAKELGIQLTEKIADNLGANYFCGPKWEVGMADCPPIEILLIKPVTNDPTIMERYTEIETQKANKLVVDETAKVKLAEVKAKNEQEAADITAKNARDLEDAEAQIAIEEANAEAAKSKAEAETAWCLALVEAGQNCAQVAAAQNGQTQMYVLPTDSSVIISPPSDAAVASQ